MRWSEAAPTPPQPLLAVKTPTFHPASNHKKTNFNFSQIHLNKDAVKATKNCMIFSDPSPPNHNEFPHKTPPSHPFLFLADYKIYDHHQHHYHHHKYH
ncbi:hypothetical protein RHGRI_000217 [Rhododendron griersonianum]|uniref:Uncharacterized protein n=1 Tax=Rhododendron griersonianum TaxID=479676 RepID=A0AAV6LGX8_9ERIC|nr:hypothetical protein RHGRI_000217 [Rhododendron griersonianum]